MNQISSYLMNDLLYFLDVKSLIRFSITSKYWKKITLDYRVRIYGQRILHTIQEIKHRYIYIKGMRCTELLNICDPLNVYLTPATMPGDTVVVCVQHQISNIEGRSIIYMYAYRRPVKKLGLITK